MKKLNKKAFTLLELVVTIAIVAILAVLVLPSVNKQIDKAKFSKVKSDLDGYIKSVNLFYTDNNRYPTNKEELENYMTRKFAKNPYKGEYIYNGVGDVYLDVTNLPQDVKIKLMNELKKNSAIVDENYRYYFKAGFLNKTVDELIQEEGYIPLANLGDVKAMDGTTTHTFAQGTQYEVTKEAGTYGLNSKYILVNDIELDSSYRPHDNFTGILNGNGHKIAGGGALFNSNDGEMINLELEDVNIQNQSVVVEEQINKNEVIQNVRGKIQSYLQGLKTPATINWNDIANNVINNVADVSNIEFRNVQDTYSTAGTYTAEFRITFSDDTQSNWLSEEFYVISGSSVVKIVAGYNHSLALMEDGTVKAWGRNLEGQLGLGDTTNRLIPTTIPNLTGVKQIVAGGEHSLVLMEDGIVKVWGFNGYGQLGLGDTTNRKIPTTIPNLTGVKQIEAGGYHSLALMEDGTVKAWGMNNRGQLGLGDTTNRKIPTTIPSLTGVKEIVAGGAHSFALMKDGTVKAWGGNWEGQLGLGDKTDRKFPTTIPNLTGVKEIVAGGYHSLALMEDGTVKAWGLNGSGQLGLGDTTNRLTPTTIPNLTGLKQIVAGYGHTFALMEDGTVKAWGWNSRGQLGLGDTTTRTTPTTIPNLTGVKEIVAGGEHSLALMEDGIVKAWGFNGYGQLGLGDTTNRLTPTTIPGLGN